MPSLARLTEGVTLVFTPAKVVFAGVGVLLLRDPHHLLHLNRQYGHDVLTGPDSVVCIYICIHISIAALIKNSILVPTVIAVQQRQSPRLSPSPPLPWHQQWL
ncbi:hypothetical protein H4582DRAFT_2161626 [Lactarius indigo]|nr:hypothetical protein H4582DRAFT_2161626 [Lactarius indigo]